ncbi:MAG: hypothetical protein OWU33_05545 [Firmicutes bacterium]|nr:hypothetical protein [Bacillota bacterium]
MATRAVSAIPWLLTVWLAGCGLTTQSPSRAAGPHTQSAPTQNGPATWVKTPSRWLSYDASRRVAMLTLTLAPTVQNESYLLNGAPMPGQQWTMPPGWHVVIHAYNGSAHSLILALVSPQGQTLHRSRLIPSRGRASVRWVSPKPGSYQLAWYMAGQHTPLAGLAMHVKKNTMPNFFDPYSKAAKYAPISPAVKRPE